MKTCVHIGTESTATASHTQSQTDAVVAALVAAIPSADYIAIGTYLNYPSDIQKWATSIHNAGKKMWLRSLGFNDWRGANSAAQYTSSDFAAHSTVQFVNFVNSNYSLFAPGDVFSPVPDNPELNSRWNAQYGNITSGAGQSAFNSFLTDAINQIGTTFTNNGVSGVDVKHIFTSPETAKKTITEASADVFTVMCTDHFPEGTTAGDPSALLSSLLSNFFQYTIFDKILLPKHITVGPNKNFQLSQNEQKDALRKYLYLIQKSYSALDGITVYEFGSTDNSGKARLFDYTTGTWTPRNACAMVEYYFSELRKASTTRYPTSDKNIRFVYLYGTDQSVDAYKLKKFKECAYRIQAWYAMNTYQNKTFTIKNPSSPVETLQLGHTASYYADKSGNFDITSEAWTLLGEGNSRDLSNHWVFCTDFPFSSGSANYNSSVVFDIFGELTNIDPTDTLHNDYHAAGAYAHEIGHTFGLDHPISPPSGSNGGEWETLMGTNYAVFPKVFLNRADLKELATENHNNWGADGIGSNEPSTGRAVPFLQETWGINAFGRMPRF